MAKIGYKIDANDFNLLDSNNNPYINSSNFDYAIVENIDDIQFKHFGAISNYDKWHKGRLFGKKTELKWQKRNGKFHIVVITEKDLPVGFTLFSENSEPFKDDKGNNIYRQIYLWGEQEKDASGKFTGKWFEERIPQFLEYPLKTDKSRVRVKLQEYKLFEEREIMKNGKIEKEEFISIVHRFVGLEEC